MGPVEVVAQRARIRVRRAGRVALFSGADAVLLLAALEREGITVIGVDGYRISGSEIGLDMTIIADFSGAQDPAESCAEAKEFVAHFARDDVYFEFAVDGEAARRLCGMPA